MNLAQCANGHYYDMDKYSICPYCSGSGANETPAYGPTEGTPFFGDDDPSTVTQSAWPEGKTDGNLDVTISAGREEETSDNSPTIGVINWEAVKNNERIRAQGGKLSAEDEILEKANPVVGWLVCIAGTNFGQSFTLHTGRNFIGRLPDKNDVGLSGDISISKEKHAIVIYEPKQRQFYVQSGENSHELVYLNDTGVFSNTVLKERDVISLGQTSLVFIPFCNEAFGWGMKTEE